MKFRKTALAAGIAAVGVLVSPGSSWASTAPYQGMVLQSWQRVAFVHNSSMRIQSVVPWQTTSKTTHRLYNPGEVNTSAVLQKHVQHGWVYHWYTWDNVGSRVGTGWTHASHGTLRNKLYCQHGTFRVHVSQGAVVTVGSSWFKITYTLHATRNSKPVTIKSCR